MRRRLGGPRGEGDLLELLSAGPVLPSQAILPGSKIESARSIIIKVHPGSNDDETDTSGYATITRI
jgi:hypothetical protein